MTARQAGSGSLVGVTDLARLALRTDRVWLPAWIVPLSLIPTTVASTFEGLYADEVSRRQLVATIGANPGLVAMMGPVKGSSIGALTAWRVGTIGCLLVGLMAVLIVVRHTRVEEETGRRELLGSTVVGRQAPLTAALLVAGGAALVIGVLVAAGLVASGQPLGGAIAFGLGWWSAGIVFAGVGAVAAQLTEGSGAARGIGVAAVGVAFVLRLVGDTSVAGLSWLSWLSPIGWFAELQPFAGERWAVLALAVAVTAAAAACAFGLAMGRDIGSGAVRPRIGPRSAGPLLSSPLGLAWRMQRPAAIGWTAAVLGVSVVYGGLGDSVGQLLDENPDLAELFEQLGQQDLLIDLFFAAALGVIAVITAAFAVRSAMQLKAEEDSQRTDWVLATATHRLGLAGSHLLIAIAVPVVMLAFSGLVTGIVHGLVSGDDLAAEAGRFTRAALLHAPAVWVVVGLSAALYGLVPRWSGVAWSGLAASFLLGQLGPMLQLPQWVMNLSPFTHVPAFPDVAVRPLLGLTAVAAALVAAGLAGFVRRDLV